MADLPKWESGYRGEKDVDYYLDFIANEKFHILHDVRLLNNHAFQMDTLIICPNFILIMEVKNWSGTIYFDAQFDQVIRTDENGKVERFSNPLTQVHLQRVQLMKWLQNKNLSHIPIEIALIFSNPKAILKASDDMPLDSLKQIRHLDQIFQMTLELEEKYKKIRLNHVSLKKLSSLILQYDTPLFIDILKTFQINRSDIIKGVQCPGCLKFAMKRAHGKWICPHCSISSKTAHHQAIEDFFLLFNSQLNNKSCRDFLLLSSRGAATRILASMNLIPTGNFRGRKYRYSFIDRVP